jgi:transposase
MWVRVRLLLPPRSAKLKGGRPFADGKAYFVPIVYQLRSLPPRSESLT